MERTYVIPLRREFRKVPKYKRAKKAVKGVKDFLTRHMKPGPDTMPKLGRYLNLELWKHGIRNPPPRVKVIATRDEKGQVWAELFGAPVDKPKEAPKKKESSKEKIPENKTETTTQPTPIDAKIVQKKPEPVANNETPAQKPAPKKTTSSPQASVPKNTAQETKTPADQKTAKPAQTKTSSPKK